MSTSMTPEEQETSRLFRIYKTILEMVSDRGYQVAQAQMQQNLEQFKATYCPNGRPDRATMSFIVKLPDERGGAELLVVFHDEKVGKEVVKQIFKRMQDSQYPKAILVYQKSLTSQANQIVQEMQQQYSLELFNENDLLVNITKHVLVPRHEVMSRAEKKQLLDRYRLRETQLPRIQIHDPISKYYGLKRGDVVRIIRPSETAGKYVTYRLCW
ncbi:hypothetical protein SeMB42_g02141 [Synchytrium endobioticum]|uniref:DNA-directed RNA polymerases I, II, and III subunit RPABC1 n=1 Tax=Synchytrium endobioticum TaxID=286115 RepID=A0A507CNG6_9FUNG|nr:hypothetical protein SeLEV6574_g06487 [Synchytrium endobioticum]TPX50712.1 hypothetical protein SeMB42_g02141 [Synchytrium endobioticum]